jgi:beta-1,4-mannosyl-glycoprotein beta-1,4-N-acetylglucosaminyltransferase
MKIIDAFIFYNELDLLKYRLNILNDVVDNFIIVESTHTFFGRPKPLFFNENKHLFNKFSDKIIHIIVEDFPYKIENSPHVDTWNNETFQRNAVSRGISKINLDENDFIIMADLDEIPDPNAISKIKNNEISLDFGKFVMDAYYYNLKSRFDAKCTITPILTFGKYKQLNTSCHTIRRDVPNATLITPGGWHLSYFGNTEFIKNKIQQFSHTELNKEEYTNEDNIKTCIDNSVDLFHRPEEIIRKVDIKDNTYLPPQYDTYLTNFM